MIMILGLTQLTFKCKVYGMKFEEEKQLQIHKKSMEENQK